MPKQADAAEEILLKNGGPMHYTAIVDEAVKLKLIERTTKNAATLYANVRKALATDARFIKTDIGVFNLADRRSHSAEQKDSIAMAASRSPEDVARNLEAMMIALDRASGVLEVPMEKIRDVFAYRRNGSKVAQEIEETLLQRGLGHFPMRLDVKQHVTILLYRIDSVAGRLVNAVREEGRTDEKHKDILDKVREIVRE